MKPTNTPPPADTREADNAAGAGCMARLVRRSFHEQESRRKSLIEDEITKAANQLTKANDEVMRLKKLIGEKAAEYKLMCNHGEYLDLASRLGISSRTVLNWRKDAACGKKINNGTLYRKGNFSSTNSQDHPAR